MGKSKFRISDMMPNSWFYKLRDMSKPRRFQDNSKPFESTENLTSMPPRRTNISNRSSYYISSEEREDKLNKQSFKALDTHFPFEPLISPKLRLETKPSKPNYTKSISSVSPKGFDFHSLESCTVTESPKDIIFDLVLTSPEIKLRPIVTKPIVKKEEKRKNRGTKIKVRSISPRCNSQRKWILESLVVVKYTRNPEKDFTESMIEMIIENNIMKTKDLEELLACYLSLNSKEYHNIIIKAFEKIWFVFSTCHI